MSCDVRCTAFLLVLTISFHRTDSTPTLTDDENRLDSELVDPNDEALSDTVDAGEEKIDTKSLYAGIVLELG